jgi:cell division protein FtsW
MTHQPPSDRPVPRVSPTYDVQLLFPVLFLVGIGIAMVYSASSALAMGKFGSDYFFVKKQAIFAVLGVVGLVITSHIPYRLYRPLAYPLLATAIVMLAAVRFTPLGTAAGGALRWLNIAGLSFQPSEFARLALVIYLAYSLSKKGENLNKFTVGFLPHVVVFGTLAGLLMLQPDFGSSVILGAITWIMLFIGGVPLRHLATGLLALGPTAYYMMINTDYRLRRFTSFLDPWQYPQHEGYQITHSLMAFGSGGLWGSGIGKSYQKLFYLPEPHTDFIFSVIGEELGLWGVLVIMALFVLILWRGTLIARHAADSFGALLAMGLTTALILQVSINMAVSLGLLPTKGLTLPFLSYGGTSLLLNLLAVGILINISATSPRRANRAVGGAPRAREENGHGDG